MPVKGKKKIKYENNSHETLFFCKLDTHKNLPQLFIRMENGKRLIPITLKRNLLSKKGAIYIIN